jgi:hypothetical protein
MTRNERLTLTISTLALIVSGLSFLDNHVTVMPKIKVSPMATSMPLTEDPLNVPIWLTIANEGHLDATVTEIDATPFSTVLQDAQKDACNRDLLNAETNSTRDFGILGDIPKDQRKVGRINPYIKLPKSCSQIPAAIGVALVIKYRDFLHIPYSQTEAVRATLAKDSTPPVGK